MKKYSLEQVTEILQKHKLWLAEEEGGERADLSGANLSSAYLSNADLSNADLSGAYLSGAKHLYLLPAQDPRGYSWPHAIQCDGGEWRIRAGGRFFTIPEARDHWGESYEGERRIGDMYLHAVDWLEKVIAEDYPHTDKPEQSA